MTQEQLLDDEPGLNGLAEPHIISEQQIGPWRGESTPQWLELVRLYVDAGPEGCLVPIGVSRRDRPPSHGINEAREGRGVIKGIGRDALRESLGWSYRLANFELPHNCELLTKPILVEGLEINNVREARR